MKKGALFQRFLSSPLSPSLFPFLPLSYQMELSGCGICVAVWCTVGKPWGSCLCLPWRVSSSSCQKGHPGCFVYGFSKPQIVRKSRRTVSLVWRTTQMSSAFVCRSIIARIHLSGCLPSCPSPKSGRWLDNHSNDTFLDIEEFCYFLFFLPKSFFHWNDKSVYSPLSFFAIMFKVTVRTVWTIIAKWMKKTTTFELSDTNPILLNACSVLSVVGETRFPFTRKKASTWIIKPSVRGFKAVQSPLDSAGKQNFLKNLICEYQGTNWKSWNIRVHYEL